jgi:hypothetical protein
MVTAQIQQKSKNWITILGPFTGAGKRGLLTNNAISTLAHSERILSLPRPRLPAEPISVRAI